MFPHVSQGRGAVVERVPFAGHQKESTVEAGSLEHPARMSELLPHFLAHAVYEWGFSRTTVKSYADDVLWLIRVGGDLPPARISEEHLLGLKTAFARRGVGPARVRRLMNGVRSFLKFCRLALGIETLDPGRVRGPKVPRREVIFLTPEEVRRFLSAIPVYTNNGGRHSLNRTWVSFRALVEVLLGTGMRISEAVSLKRSSVNFETGEAKIIGKGNKERVVFFSPRALGWLKEYLNRRRDKGEWLFALPSGKPLQVKAVQHRFRKVQRLSGLAKKVSPHILRHTFATTLQMNGAPIGLIKELLGHEMLETTCRFYLGVDKRQARQAVRRYLDYDLMEDGGARGGWEGEAGGSERAEGRGPTRALREFMSAVRRW